MYGSDSGTLPAQGSTPGVGLPRRDKTARRRTANYPGLKLTTEDLEFPITFKTKEMTVVIVHFVIIRADYFLENIPYFLYIF